MSEAEKLHLELKKLRKDNNEQIKIKTEEIEQLKGK